LLTLCFICNAIIILFAHLTYFIERKPQKVTRFGADPTVKASWRFIRTWVCHNHKFYYSYVVLCAFGMWSAWWYTCVGYYRRRNYERGLPYAQMVEKAALIEKAKREAEEEAMYGGEDDEGEESPVDEGLAAPADDEDDE
jgi:hypothetical protein